MAKTVEGLYYSESHEWVKVEGNVAIVGITDFAQHAMGDLSYVDMPEVDDELEKGEEFGAVESVKSTTINSPHNFARACLSASAFSS